MRSRQHHGPDVTTVARLLRVASSPGGGKRCRAQRVIREMIRFHLARRVPPKRSAAAAATIRHDALGRSRPTSLSDAIATTFRVRPRPGRTSTATRAVHADGRSSDTRERWRVRVDFSPWRVDGFASGPTTARPKVFRPSRDNGEAKREYYSTTTVDHSREAGNNAIRFFGFLFFSPRHLDSV